MQRGKGQFEEGGNKGEKRREKYHKSCQDLYFHDVLMPARSCETVSLKKLHSVQLSSHSFKLNGKP